jgi:hypothetical protein
MAPQFASRRQAISGGEISTMDAGEEGKPERLMPMSLILVLLTRALALFLGQHFCRVHGSDGEITLSSEPSLLLTLEETWSAFTRISVKGQSKRLDFRHH